MLVLTVARDEHRARVARAGTELARSRHAVTVLTRPLEVRRKFESPDALLAGHRDTSRVLLPFPALRMGWGLDAYWAALAAEHGWRLGVVDATPMVHRVRPPGDAYFREPAIAAARALPADHPYLPAAQSERTLAVHRRCG